MRNARYLVFLVTLLTFSNSQLFSQINPGSFADVYSQDSLQGFDINLASQQAQGEGFTGQDFSTAIRFYKRKFVINKYNLDKDAMNPVSSGGKYSAASTANAPCVNSGFENGSISGWGAFLGTNTNSQNYPNTPTSITTGVNLAVLTTPLTDAFVGTIPNSPLGGTRVVRLNNSSANASVVKLSQTFNVTATNYLFDFAYWAVMQDAGTSGLPHTCSETPYMLIKIRDNFNILQTCPTFSIVAPSSGSGGCAGIGPLTWVNVGSGINTIKTSNGWQQFSIDLTPYITNPVSNITVEVFVGDCSLGGHWGYAYFDARCNTMDLTVNSQTISMPSPTVVPQVLCGTTATMTAPAGLGPYIWNGPAGSGITNSTLQTVVTPVPGNYSLTMSPAGICNPISKIINLQFVPPTTITVSQNNLCASGTNTSSTLSASGAAQYTWMPGGSNSSSITVSPTITTVYTLTARTGTCSGTYTREITVNPDPVINVLASNSSLCPGQTATLTAFGATSYVWNPGNLTGSLVVVSQTMATTYTTIGTSAAGCTGSVTTSIGISPAPPVSIFPATVAPICVGGVVNLIGVGAPAFTWQPGNLSGIFQTFSPTVTTTYTAIGSSGSCTNSAFITVTVDPGPPMTITRNPTLTCPGNTTTLSVTSASAVGAFTWNPGAINASSIVVTPTLAGGYSVSAVNALGCRNTQTINPNISPVPTIVVSPSSPSICVGRSATLTASGAVNYTWQPGNLTGATAVVSPTNNTTYTVTGANGIGCVNQTVVTVTVLPLPTINAVVTPTAICAGSCATISPSGASTYSIQGGAFVVCPTITTTYTMTGTSAAGCVSLPITRTVVVNSTPVVSVSASPATICAGSSSTLTASGAITYTWSTGATGVSAVVSPTSTSIFTVTGANAFGCTRTATVQVNVIPLPNISINPATPTVCSGNTLALSASGAVSYTWNPGGLTGANVNVSPLVNTIYTVTGSNATCVGQRTVLVTVVPGPTVTAPYTPSVICAGSCATLNPSGAVTYSVLGLSSVACPTVTSSYTVRGTNAAGCVSAPFIGTLTVNPAPNIVASVNVGTICPGDSALVSATGGISYTWQPGNISTTSFFAKPLTTTTYTALGINASGCTRTATVQVVVTPAPTIAINPSTPTLCLGGSVNISATGATSYTWNPGNLSGASINISPAATTIYTVRGSNGACTGQNTVQVSVSPLPVIGVTSSTTTVCAGSCATLTPSGGVTYTFSGGGSPIVCPTVTTTYSVTGANASGCTGNTATITINVNSLPVINATASATSICNPGATNLFASGGTSYTWQPINLQGSSIIVTPSITTIYTVFGRNASGCIGSNTIQIQVTPAPNVTVVATPSAICSGSTAALSASGASSYFWIPGSLSGANVFVSPTVTTVYTVTGSNGACTGSTQVTLVVNPNPTIGIIASSTSICAGASATLTATGGNAYLWSTASTATTIVVSPLTSTTFSVGGISAAGCIGTPTFVNIVVTPSPAISATVNPAGLCAGSSATLSASGATSYTWQPGSLTGSSIIVTPTTSLIYTVSGQTGPSCSGIQTVAVNVSPSVNVVASAAAPTICLGDAVGLNATGASSYTWFPGNVNLSGFSPSPTITTTYTVFGSNGVCVGQSTVLVVVAPIPTITTSASSPSVCAGGSATITANGASTYTWFPGNLSGSSIVVSPSVTTTYSVFGTSNGCLSGTTRVITVVPNPVIFAVATPSAICAGGSSTLAAGGATSFTWLPGSITSATAVVNPAVSTVYTVTGSVPGGCTGSTTAFVAVNPLPVISASASVSSICQGQSTNLSASGATSYTWLPGNLSGSSVNVSPNTTTTYTVIGLAGSCTGSAIVTVTVNPVPAINASASSAFICAGASATLTATGAASYSWLPVNQSGSSIVVNPLVSTIYTVTGTNGTGCSGTQTVSINVGTAPSLSISASANPLCSGSSATLTASGATNYTWQPGGVGASIPVSPTITTVYNLIGANGTCTSSITYTVIVNTGSVAASASSSSVCAGFTTALLASGAGSYTWQPGGSSSNPLIVSPTATQIYTVLGSNGICTASSTIQITVVPLPNVSLSANPATICPGDITTLTAGGAATYSWIPGLQGGTTFTDNPSVTTTYTVVGISAAGCPNFTTTTVVVVPATNVSIVSSNTAVCSGGSATLTASGAASYTWNPGLQTGNTIVVSPVTPTTYTVIGSNGSCTGSATILMGINPLPTITAVANTASICPGSNVQLTASGGVNYTWTPSGLTGANITFNPANSTTFTVTGEDANGCAGSANVSVFVFPQPLISALASPSDICEGGSTTLTANGGINYTWTPANQTGNSIVVSPNTTTSYTVTGDDANGCLGGITVTVNVFPTPTVVISPANPTICVGTSLTLTATGATNYTWLPGNSNNDSLVVSPLVLTTYTVIGDNAGGQCFSSTTIDVFVNPIPQNVTATSSGTVSCATPSVTLSGTSTDPNVTYAWVGPQGYNSNAQNPVISGIWGTFTLLVTDNVTGCSATATVDVPTDNSIPLVTPVTSGSITCAITTVTLNAINTTTNPAYEWTGPGSFTSNVQSPTISLPGSYTISVIDLSSGCTGTAVITVESFTNVTITASIAPSTCQGGTSNNDGTITLFGFGAADKFDFVAGNTYTGTATYLSATNIPFNGIITSTLANPSNTLEYTVRIFDDKGCIKDTTLVLVPVDCSLKTLGIAKAVSAPELNGDGSYNLTYTVVAKNYELGGFLSNLSLVENLSATFPAPTTFTVMVDSLKTIGGTTLLLNSGFDGVTQTDLLNSTASNSLAGQDSTVIEFKVKVNPGSFFVPFSNSVLGEATNGENVVIRDSSNTGLNPDPDNDKNPYNNNVPTIITFSPNVFFGITKVGEINKSDSESFDISYTVTVHNLGNDTIRNITLKDSLFEKTIKNPATYSMRSAPVVLNGGLSANSSFNGNTNIDLVQPAASKLAPGTTSSVRFVINVVTGTVASIANSAYGNGEVAINLSEFATVSDTSNAGTNPDVNANGIWNEAEDNVPTVLLVPNTNTLFIPEGFSPDGDNINPFFVIKGLPQSGENALTIFNRWGNKVYYNGNYDNSWDGTPNVSGTLGKDKLPQGTYYYILEMKGSGAKPITGFVVLQY